MIMWRALYILKYKILVVKKSPPPFFVQCNFFSFIKKWYVVSPFVSDSGIFSKNLVVPKMAVFVFLFFNRLLSLSWRIASIPTPPNCCWGGWGAWGGLVSSSSLSVPLLDPLDPKIYIRDTAASFRHSPTAGCTGCRLVFVYNVRIHTCWDALPPNRLGIFSVGRTHPDGPTWNYVSSWRYI